MCVPADLGVSRFCLGFCVLFPAPMSPCPCSYSAHYLSNPRPMTMIVCPLLAVSSARDTNPLILLYPCAPRVFLYGGSDQDQKLKIQQWLHLKNKRNVTVESTVEVSKYDKILHMFPRYPIFGATALRNSCSFKACTHARHNSCLVVTRKLI